MDTRIDRGGAGGVGESGCGEVVRRNRVLVRDDQSHHDYRDDCRLAPGVIFFGFGNGGQSIGFSNLTEHGGFFAGGWKGFPDRIVYCGGVLPGVELIGITAGEAKNPQVTLRSAVGKVLWRILIFYVGAIFRYRYHLPVE